MSGQKRWEDVPAPELANFFSPHYQRHNLAVLAHLAGLGLPLSNQRVLELGSGPGDQTGFYVERGCSVVSVDSRQACLNMLVERFPEVRAVRCDLNDPSPLLRLGMFDVVHCYGILYHLEHPARLISYMGEACGGIALIQTCVSPDERDCLVEEWSGDFTQSSTGRGCRPSRKLLFDELQRHFPFVYQTRTQPANPEFPVNWKDLRDAPPLVRAVFVASRRPLDLESLSPTLLDTQEPASAPSPDDPSPSVGRCREWISTIRTLWDEVERRKQDLERARDLEAAAGERLAVIEAQAQRSKILQAAAEERLEQMVEKDRVIAELHAELERAHELEAATAERLAVIAAQDRRIEVLQAAADERLAQMVEKDRVITELHAELERARAALAEQEQLLAGMRSA
jgi:SAM-dependent methyltransferase